MQIRASTRQRGKGDVRDDNGVGHLALTAENNDEREFITAVYRILVEDDKQQEQGVATMRRFLSDFPVEPSAALLRQIAKKGSNPMADEYTVEHALAELREMFCGKAVAIRRDDAFYPADCQDGPEVNSVTTIKIGYLESEPKFRSFRSLSDCMAQVKKWREDQS